MSRYSIITTAVFSFMSLVIWGQSVFSEISPAVAFEQARKEKKLVMIKFYADQCTACKWMDTHVFTDPRIDSLIQKDYISIRSHSGTIEGKKIQSRWRIKMLPTLIIIDPDSELELARLEGKKTVDYMLEFLLKAEHSEFPTSDPERDREPLKPGPRVNALKEEQTVQS